MTEDEIRGLLRAMKDEPVPADSLARVRLGVAERTRARRWWGWGLVAALAAVVLMALLLRPVDVPVIEVAHRVAPPPMVEVAAPVKAPVKRKVARRRKSEAMVVRIETADPDVVILLVGD